MTCILFLPYLHHQPIKNKTRKHCRFPWQCNGEAHLNGSNISQSAHTQYPPLIIVIIAAGKLTQCCHLKRFPKKHTATMSCFHGVLFPPVSGKNGEDNWVTSWHSRVTPNLTATLCRSWSSRVHHMNTKNTHQDATVR